MKDKIFWKSLFKKDRIWRWVLLFVLVSIPVLGGEETREVFFSTLSDAYIQVTVFVALTLFIFYGLEALLKVDTEALLKKHKKYQIPISAIVGALPGCGGAIMIMTQYSVGRLGFGSVVAVLTSTMGDAAFLLLAKEPKTALFVFVISLTIGILFGYLVEKIHGYDFLRQNANSGAYCGGIFHYEHLKLPWVLLFIPGIVLGLMTAFQMDTDLVVGIDGFTLWFGAIGAILSILLWFFNPNNGPSVTNRFEEPSHDSVWDKTTADTCFITLWVVIAFLLFELGIHWTAFDLKGIFDTVKPLVPLMAVVIGFLPGCGPQVLVTTLYLQGYIPLSAQLGNAISNDGDALFPALAVSPKASFVATIYTAIPALIVAYLYFFLMEGGF